MADNLRYQVVGFLIVMTVLASIWLVLRIVGFFFVRRTVEDTRQVPSTAPPPSPGIAAAAPHAETIVVITAAVHTVLEGPYRIVSISEHLQEHLGAWSIEGRRQIFSSHKVR